MTLPDEIALSAGEQTPVIHIIVPSGVYGIILPVVQTYHIPCVSAALAVSRDENIIYAVIVIKEPQYLGIAVTDAFMLRNAAYDTVRLEICRGRHTVRFVGIIHIRYDPVIYRQSVGVCSPLAADKLRRAFAVVLYQLLILRASIGSKHIGGGIHLKITVGVQPYIRADIIIDRIIVQKSIITLDDLIIAQTVFVVDPEKNCLSARCH